MSPEQARLASRACVWLQQAAVQRPFFADRTGPRSSTKMVFPWYSTSCIMLTMLQTLRATGKISGSSQGSIWQGHQFGHRWAKEGWGEGWGNKS